MCRSFSVAHSFWKIQPFKFRPLIGGKALLVALESCYLVEIIRQYSLVPFSLGIRFLQDVIKTEVGKL